MAEEDNKNISTGLANLTQILKEESAADKTDNLIDEIRNLANSVKGLSSEFGQEFGSLIAQSNQAVLNQDVEGQASLQEQLGVLKEIAELQKSRNEKMAEEYTQSYMQSELTRSINMTLDEQKRELESIKEQETLASTEKLIERLEENGSNEFSQQLSADFQELKVKLENPDISDEERAHYKDLLEKIGESGQSEEERREANKMSNRMIKTMDGIIDGLEKFGDALDDMIGNFAKGAGLAALALLFFDPEALADILTGVITFVTDTVHAIAKIFEGDFSAMADLITDHPFLSAFAALYATFKAITFFTKAIRSGIVVWQGLTKAFGFAMKAARWLMGPIRWLVQGIMALGPMLMSAGSAIISGIGTAFTFLTSTVIPAVISGISAAFGAIAGAIGTFFSAVLVPLAPFIAIGAAIAAIGYSILEGVQRAFDIFNETGSIMDAIVGGISGILGTLVALPFDILKSIVSTVAGWLGFEEFEAWLDSFSFADMFTEAFDAAFAMIGSVLSGIWDIITYPFTALNTWIAETFGIDIGAKLTEVVGDIWSAITEPLGKISDFLGSAFDNAIKWVEEKLSWIPGVGGLTDEQEMALESAQESGLYDKDLMGNSELNRDMVANATMEQLDAIRADADLSEEDMQVITDELARRTANPNRRTSPMAAEFDAGATAQEIFDTEAQAFDDAVGTNTAQITEAVAEAEPQVQNAGTVSDFMTTVPLVDDITAIFNNVTDWVIEKTEELIDWLAEFAFLQPVFEFVESVTEWVGEKVEAVMDFLEEIDIFESLKDGIESLSNFLGDAIDGAINWVQEKLSWIPGIDAPEPRANYNEGDPERLRQAREAAGLAPEGSNTSVEQNQAMTYQALVDQGFEEDEIANIMGMMQGESGFRPAVEGSYRNTSNERIREAMGNRVADLSDAELTELKQDDQAFYDHVYGDSMGNDGEGFKYRGRGFIQLTGKDNYERYGDMIGVDLVNNPELAADPEIASQIAAAYMKDREGLFDDYSDMGDVYENVYGVNPEDMRRGASRDMRMEDMAVRQGYADDFRTRIASGSYDGSFDTSSMVARTEPTPPVQGSGSARTLTTSSIVAEARQPISLEGSVTPVSEGRTSYMVNNQVANNDLTAEERAAAQEANMTVAMGGSQSVRSNNTSVSAPTYNVNNDNSPDRVAFDMVSLPIG